MAIPGRQSKSNGVKNFKRNEEPSATMSRTVMLAGTVPKSCGLFEVMSLDFSLDSFPSFLTQVIKLFWFPANNNLQMERKVQTLLNKRRRSNWQFEWSMTWDHGTSFY